MRESSITASNATTGSVSTLWWRLRGLGRHDGAMCQFPFSPSNDALFGAWQVREHGDVLQQVPVGIVKEHGRGRHPGEHHGLVSRLPVKVERRDARRSQSARCFDNICQARAKRRVQRHPQRA